MGLIEGVNDEWRPLSASLGETLARSFPARTRRLPKAALQDALLYDRRAPELCISAVVIPDLVLHGSDHPHNIGDMAACLARVNALPADQARRVPENAEKLIGFWDLCALVCRPGLG